MSIHTESEPAIANIKTHPAAAKTVIHPPQGIPKSLMASYLDRCRNGVPNLRAAVESQDFTAIRVFGHRMKGTGGAYGLGELSEIGRLIEIAATDRKIANLQEMVSKLGSYLATLELADT